MPRPSPFAARTKRSGSANALAKPRNKGIYKEIYQEALEKNHLPLTPAIITKHLAYLALLDTWNKAYNLTAITDPREMIYLHLIDSLLIQPHLQGSRLLDVGSGAGLPGIPLAIANPEQQWVLLDKNSKKTRFLTQAIAELELSNITAVHSRVEDFQPAMGFDSIVSRAFGTIRLFTETTEHLLNTNGILLAMKGKYPATELAEIPAHFTVAQSIRLDIKGIAVERHLISLRKRS
jgi:16S rRNA (guanine527-N7)-methyltransferase